MPRGGGGAGDGAGALGAGEQLPRRGPTCARWSRLAAASGKRSTCGPKGAGAWHWCTVQPRRPAALAATARSMAATPVAGSWEPQGCWEHWVAAGPSRVKRGRKKDEWVHPPCCGPRPAPQIPSRTGCAPPAGQERKKRKGSAWSLKTGDTMRSAGGRPGGRANGRGLRRRCGAACTSRSLGSGCAAPAAEHATAAALDPSIPHSQHPTPPSCNAPSPQPDRVGCTGWTHLASKRLVLQHQPAARYSQQDAGPDAQHLRARPRTRQAGQREQQQGRPRARHGCRGPGRAGASGGWVMQHPAGSAPPRGQPPPPLPL
jgi:hypothetical protein